MIYRTALPLLWLVALFQTPTPIANDPNLTLAPAYRSEPNPMSEATEATDIDAQISVYAYDYKVKVLINGNDIGITGGKSENQRLFTTNDSQAKEVPADMRQKYFVLNEGENRLVVEFTKTDLTRTGGMDLHIVLDGYPLPLFFLHSHSKPSGRIEKTIVVRKAVPEGFKPIFVSDDSEDRAAYVHSESQNCDVMPRLNGKPQNLQSIGGVTPLRDVIAGKNELVISYKCRSGSKGDLTFAVMTPETTKFYTRKITDAIEHKETFEFTAK